MEAIRYTRIKYNNAEYYAEIEGDTAYILDKSYFDGGKRTGESVTESEALALTPVENNKIVCIGKNYADHAKEMGSEIPEEPLMFLKPNTCLLPHNGKIIIPKISERVDYEAELAVVIGKTAKDINEEEYKDYIFGYTCANDVTARDLQARDGQWTRGKGFDTFLPLGPYIIKDINPESLDIKLYLNNELKQSSNTKSFIFDIKTILKAVTDVMTLYPGDVILTGTPEGIGQMKNGDIVRVEIAGVGTLSNEVLGASPQTPQKGHVPFESQ